MENFEKVERLREKANVSYEDAKEAMEACNYDMLDAMIYLEKHGKVNAGSTASYTTSSGADTSQEFEQAQRNYEDSCQRTSCGEILSKIGKLCSSLIQKSLEVDFCVTKNEKMILKVPVLALVLALLISFGFFTVLMIVGLFCGCRYYFQGIGTTTINLNQMCETASETCQNIKNDFQNK